MQKPLVIRGRFSERSFRADDPMPDVEGPAELIVFPHDRPEQRQAGGSVLDLFGRARHLRSADDIDAQVRHEREAWERG